MTRALRLAMLACVLFASAAHAQRVPLSDLGTGIYLGFEGGLYEHGSNVVPADHLAAGLQAASRIVPRDAAGSPSAAGKIVMLSIGMSNTTQEFCAAGNPAPCTSWSFVGQATADPSVNHSTLLLVNGARGGQTAGTWESPTAANYDLVKNENLTPAGVTEKQVQVAWVKVANAQPTVSLPASNSDAYRLVAQTGNIARALKVRYPNLQIVYLSSRIYAGYATTSKLNPEPYAYESGFAVKWTIQAQVDQMRSRTIDGRAGDLDLATVAPWIAWGPYLWCDGMNPRSDLLTWAPADVASDGTHPSTSGQRKVGSMLLAFLSSDATSKPWFRVASAPKRRAVRR